MKKLYRVLLQLIVGIALVMIWLSLIDFGQVVSHIRNANFWLVLIGLGFFSLSYFIRSMRWKILLNPVCKLKNTQIFNLYMAGNFINFLVPVRLGELAKAFFVKKIANEPVTKTLPTIIVDKVADLFPIIPIIAGVFFLKIRFTPVLWVISISVLAIFVIFLITFVLSIHYHKNLTKLFLKIFFWLPSRMKELFETSLGRFLFGFSVIKRANIAAVLLLTIMAVFSDTVYFLLMFKSFGYNPGFIVVLIGYTLFVLSFILPTPPAQVGSSEIVIFLIFSGVFGIEKNLVSAVTVVSHFFTGLIIIITGVYAIYKLDLKWSWLRLSND